MKALPAADRAEPEHMSFVTAVREGRVKFFPSA